MERDGHTISGQLSNREDRPEPVYDNRGEDRVLAEETCCAEQPVRTPSPERAREINIRPLDHGYVINIGCQTFAIEQISDLIPYLEGYLRRPQETELRWTREHRF